MPPQYERSRESMRVMILGAWRPNEIVVGDMNYFCEKLEVRKAVPQADALSELGGIRVRESRLMPMNRASLIDETGKVIRVFEL